MEGDVLAQGHRHVRVGDLLEAEQAVVERADRLEGAEADVEVAVEALRRRRRGDDHGRAGLRGRPRDAQDARHDRRARGCRRGLKKVASVELRSLKAQMCHVLVPLRLGSLARLCWNDVSAPPSIMRGGMKSINGLRRP